jgi:hypothetical protein
MVSNESLRANMRLSGPPVNKLPSSVTELMMRDGPRAAAQLWR